MPVIRSWAQTHVGKKRKNNEDALLAEDALGLYVVADGMGGHAAGEVASAQAIASIRAAFAENKPLFDSHAQASFAEARDGLSQLMERAIQRACAEIYALGGKDPQKRGMGTTVVALIAVGKKAVVGHVGDSRVYLFRNGRVHQLTEDHTLIQDRMKRGLLTREQAAAAEHKNVVTRAVGIQPSVAVDTLVTDLLPGDLYLLCSDGLHGYLSEDELPKLLSQERGKLVSALVDLALARGGKDNITAVALAVEADAGEECADIEGRTEILRRIPLFQHMSYKELLAILGIARGHKFEQGQAVIREGEKSDALYVLFRGKADVTKGGLPIAQLKSGDHFGEMGLVDLSPRSATVLAVEETSAVSIDRESLLKLMRQDPLLAVKLLWSLVQVLSERLRNTSEALAALSELLGKARPLGEEGGGTTPPAGQ